MSKAIHIGVFIDGTGNHRYNDEMIGNGTQSNVAKLHHVFEKTPGNEYGIYIPGVGTSSFKELGFESKNGEFKDAEGNFYDKRLQEVKEGKASLNDYYDTVALGTGYGIGGRGVEDQVDEAFEQIKGYILKIKETHPNTEINLDMVAFSRGAASERELANRLHKEGITGENVHINFIGAFDTVSSIGRADGDNGNFNLNLNANSANHIVQLVAKDEIRTNFRSEAMPQFDIKMDGVHADIGGGHSILDTKEYYADFKNYTINNDKLDTFITQHKEEAKNLGYEGVSYTVTSLDRGNQSSVYMGYVQSKDVAYGLSNVSLHKMYDEMKASDIHMTDLKVLGNAENDASYSLWEIPTELKAHPENVSEYIHNSSVDKSRVYPVGEGFVRADITERFVHRPEESGERSIDLNEPKKAEREPTLADKINKIDRGYEFGQDSHTTMRPEAIGMSVTDTFVVDVRQVDQDQTNTFDSTIAAQEILAQLNLTDFSQSNEDYSGRTLYDDFGDMD